MGGFKFLGNNGFQSTLPRVERQRLFLYLDIPGNFNPRSREWSDPLKVAPLQVMPISIHAPASGATDIIGRDVRTVQFQSTLPRVERLIAFSLSSKDIAEFQSTLPRVERPLACSENALNDLISIHAPASGATLIYSYIVIKKGFQSTLPRVERRHLLTFFRLQYGYILFHLTNKYSFCF